jgi:hypothetical protein
MKDVGLSRLALLPRYDGPSQSRRPFAAERRLPWVASAGPGLPIARMLRVPDRRAQPTRGTRRANVGCGGHAASFSLVDWPKTAVYACDTIPRMRRRSFFGALSAPALLGSTAMAQARRAQSGAPPQKIAAVEMWRVEGRRKALKGINGQYQAQPLHIYDEHRPRPYRDAPQPAERESADVRSVPQHQDRRRLWKVSTAPSIAKSPRHRSATPPLSAGQGRARRRNHLGPVAPLQPPLAPRPLHDGHQRHRQRAVGSARPLLRRTGLPSARRPHPPLRRSLWQLPRLLRRTRSRGEALPLSFAIPATAIKSGSSPMDPAAARKVWKERPTRPCAARIGR